MVFESLVSPLKAEQRPWQMIFLGMLYASLGVGLGYFISPKYSSLFMVFFTAMASMPLIYNTIRLEESKDEKGGKESYLLKEHFKALKVFIYLFIGMTIAFSIWNLALPEQMSKLIFQAQFETIGNINGNAIMTSSFFTILLNNIEVMIWCLVFSLLYGLGAIFILTWNASVIGVAIGKFIKVNIATIAAKVGAVPAHQYLQVYSCGYFVRFLPHGLLEILAYFTAGLAGGIVSVAVIRHKFGTKRFLDIIFDSADLLLISFLILIVASIIEVFFTPGLVRLLC